MPALGITLLILFLVRASTGHALVVDDASVRIDPARSDRLRLSGRAPGLAVGDSDGVTLTVDRMTFTIPTDVLARKGDRVSFRAGAGAVGVTKLRIAGEKWSAVVKNVALSGMPNPLQVRLQAGAFSDCALLELAEKKSRRKNGRRRTLVRSRASAGDGSCHLADPPVVDPVRVPVATPTSVRIRVRVDGTVDGPPEVLRVDRTGKLVEGALCGLADDGSMGAGDLTGGDGLFSCVATIEQPAAGFVPLVVRASVGGVPRLSIGFGVHVVPRPDAGSAERVLTTMRDGMRVCQETRAELGDTLAARIEAIRRLRGLVGVADAGLTADGLSIFIAHDVGLTSLILLTLRQPVPGSIPVPSLPLPPAVPLASAFRQVATGARVEGVDVTDVVGDQPALLLDPLFFPPEVDEVPYIESMFFYSSCPSVFANALYGADGSIEALRTLPEYGTFVATTHGGVDEAGRVGFVTGDPVTFENFARYLEDYYAGRLGISGIEGGAEYGYWAVQPGFISALAEPFDDTIVYLSACETLKNRTLADAFLEKGARAVVGFTESVSSDFAWWTGVNLFDRMVNLDYTVGAAFDAADPKVDYWPFGEAPARLAMVGDRNAAYLGNLALIPLLQDVVNQETIALAVHFPGSDSCGVDYAWHNTASFGHLYDVGEAPSADEFVSKNDAALYWAGPVDEGSDTVTVVLTAAYSDPELLPKPLGSASSLVTVKPGPCRHPTITLNRTHLEIENGTFEGIEAEVAPRDCTFEAYWQNTATVGHLLGPAASPDAFANSIVEGRAITYYMANPTGDDTDTVTLVVRAPAELDPQQRELARASVTVDVHELTCDDAIDNDGDGDTDCDDDDCSGNAPTQARARAAACCLPADPPCGEGCCAADQICVNGTCVVGGPGCEDPQAVVNVPSAELRAILRQQLAVPTAQPLTCADMERLTSLGIFQRQIETLEGLQFARNLTSLRCDQCVLAEVGQLSGLRNLTSLSLAQNGIVDVTPLAQLTALTSLNLYWNRIADITPLAGLTGLTFLSLWQNELTDVGALAGLTQLSELNLRQNQITSVSALAPLVRMRVLTLSFNALESLAGLQAMTALESLNVEYNYYLSDIGALRNLNALVTLDASTNSIEDVSPLDGKVALTTLDLYSNYIADLGTVDWDEIPVTQLDLELNLLTSIAPLQSLGAIADLDVSYNQISDAAPVKGLGTLRALAMRNNLISDLQPLVDNSGLGTGDVVNIQENCLSTGDPDIQTLLTRGVSVYYEPQGCTP